MSDIKLKPCPFCGSECVNDTTPPEFNDIMGFYWVCPDCVACGPASDTVYLATTSWNGRAEDGDTYEAMQARNAELESALESIRSIVTDVQDGFEVTGGDAEILDLINDTLESTFKEEARNILGDN